MEKTKIFLTATLVILLTSIGTSVKLYNHRINLEVDEENTATVKETFRLGLDSSNYLRKYDDYETNVFENISSQGTSNISKWTEFHSEIKTSLKGEVQDLSISTSEKQRTHNVIISYEHPEAVQLIEEKGRKKIYKVNTKLFKFYVNGTGLIIPDNTNLWIDLPDSIPEDSVEASPDPINRFAGNEFHWNTGTWDIKLEYRKTESISSWTIQGLAESFRKTFIDNPVYGALLLILIILAFIYRDQIKLLFSQGLASETEVEKPKRKI